MAVYSVYPDIKGEEAVEDIRPLLPGQLVRSRAGRDKGKHYLVLEFLNDRNVLLVDGGTRPLDKPKKKNIAHLQRYNRKVEGFARLVSQGKISNGGIAGYLQKLVADEEMSPRED